jgi:hypothetical protein
MQKIIPKPIFTETRTQDSFRVCDLSFCNLLAETNNFVLGASLPSCLISELQERPSPGLELTTHFPEFWPFQNLFLVSRNKHAEFGANRFICSRAISEHTHTISILYKSEIAWIATSSFGCSHGVLIRRDATALVMMVTGPGPDLRAVDPGPPQNRGLHKIQVFFLRRKASRYSSPETDHVIGNLLNVVEGGCRCQSGVERRGGGGGGIYLFIFIYYN